jgi:integrase-like protein
VGWVRRYVRFNGLRHPAELGQEDVERFLAELVDRDKVSAQALSSLLFLYRQVLRRGLDTDR